MKIFFFKYEAEVLATIFQLYQQSTITYHSQMEGHLSRENMQKNLQSKTYLGPKRSLYPGGGGKRILILKFSKIQCSFIREMALPSKPFYLNML